jgi:hypothetical protein
VNNPEAQPGVKCSQYPESPLKSVIASDPAVAGDRGNLKNKLRSNLFDRMEGENDLFDRLYFFHHGYFGLSPYKRTAFGKKCFEIGRGRVCIQGSLIFVTLHDNKSIGIGLGPVHGVA